MPYIKLEKPKEIQIWEVQPQKLARQLQVLRRLRLCRGVKQLHGGSIVLTCLPKFHA